MTTSRMRPSGNDSEAKYSNRGSLTHSPSLDRTPKHGAERVPDITNVEVSSVKTSMEIKNAVHRQRRTLGIDYASSNATTHLPRPKYHDVTPRAFPPSYTQRTISTPHGRTAGRASADSSYTVTQITNDGGVRNDVAGERIARDGSAAPALRFGGLRRNVSTITFSPNKLHTSIPDQTASPRNMGIPDTVARNMQDYRLNRFQSQGHNEGISPTVGISPVNKTLPPGLKLKDTLAAGSNNLFGFSRSLTSDRLIRRPQDSSPGLLSYNDDIGFQGERTMVDGSPFLSPRQRENVWPNVASPRWPDTTFESSLGGHFRTVSNPHKELISASTERTHTRHELIASPEAQPSKTNNLAEFSSMDLADSIIKAVSENINEVYQLCQNKVKYSDFIEKTQSHRLNGSEGFWDGLEYRKKENAISSKTNDAAKSTLTFSKRTNILPSLVSKQRDSPVSIPFAQRDTYSSNETEKVSNSPLPEPEIDYDKPITIIIESNQDGCLKATRPILKLASKSNLDSRTFENTRPGDPNNNKLTEARAFSSDGPHLTDDIFRTQGRLVRFNFDTTIHEFTPSEPVLSPK